MAERRFTIGTASVLEARASGKSTIVEGYASVYDVAYPIEGFRELVARSAFRKTAKESDVRSLFNHDPNFPLGRVRAGTLELDANDPHGLRYRILMPKNSQAQMVAEAIERGDVTGSSFSFEVIKDEWTDSDSGAPTRVLRECRLYDVGPVTFPASEATEVDVARAMRSLGLKSELDPDYLAGALRAHRLREALAGTWSPSEEASKTHVSGLRKLLDAISR